MKRHVVFAIVLIVLGLLVIEFRISALSAAQQDRPAGQVPPGPMGPGGGPQQAELKLVERFDADGNKRLNAAERSAAREWLSSNRPQGGFGRRGMPPGGGGPEGRGMAPGSPGRAMKPADARSYSSEPLYDMTTLRTIFLQFESADWEKELAAFNNTDVEVPATAIVDGRTYADVGVHFRGQSSFMMVPAGLKRSLNLSFDFVNDKQALNGYRTVNLLNAASDPTFVRGPIYSEIARAYIPAPRVNYVRVVINGENWGIYLNAQQFNKDFLRDHYKTEDGARWKVPGSPGGRGGMEYLGDDASAYKRIYDIRSKDAAKAWADLIHMFKVLNTTPTDQLEAALTPLLDVDGVLKFLAIEAALVNTDGYWTRASDYSIYQDAGGKFHVVPHDMNEALMNEGGPGRGMRGGPRGAGPGMPPDGRMGPPPDGAGRMPMGPPPGRGRGFGPAGGPELDPLVGLDDASKPLRSKLLSVPALRTRYLGYVRDIAERWLDPARFTSVAGKYRSLIAEDVKADTRKLFSTDAFDTAYDGGDGLLAFVKARRDYLLKVTSAAR